MAQIQVGAALHQAKDFRKQTEPLRQRGLRLDKAVCVGTVVVGASCWAGEQLVWSCSQQLLSTAMGCLLVSAVLEERPLHRSTLKAAQMSLGGERLRTAAPWAPFAALWWLVAPWSSEQKHRSYSSCRKESQAIALGKIC